MTQEFWGFLLEWFEQDDGLRWKYVSSVTDMPRCVRTALVCISLFSSAVAFLGSAPRLPSRPSSRLAATDATEAAARQASFEEAQVLGDDLASVLKRTSAAGEPMPEEAAGALRALVSSTSGARGWFVSLLTNPDYESIFEAPMPETMLEAICENPEPNIRLMTMNVAMSTATELAHLANGDAELAAASAMTRDRSTALCVALVDRLPGLRESVTALLAAVQPSTDPDDEVTAEWVTFCDKWGYGAEQREAIGAQLASRVLGE